MPESEPAKGKRKLPKLPPACGIVDALEWLGAEAFKLPRGYSVRMVERAGIDGDDPMTITFEGLGDDQPVIVVRFNRQQTAMRGGGLRGTLIAYSQGRFNMPHYGEADALEVFAGLCIAAGIPSESDQLDEAREWVEETRRNAEPLTGFSLVGSDEQARAIEAIRARPTFDKRGARDLINYILESGNGPGPQRQPLRPMLLVDRLDGHQYLRTGETHCYARNLGNAPPTSQPRFDARLAEVNVRRRRFIQRAGHRVLTVTLYELPELSERWQTSEPERVDSDV